MRKRNRCGFTLGEMVTTVAIVGTLAAIAVPGYLKVRSTANMEMVRQHMRLIAEKMTEILGRENQFPDPALWPFSGTGDDDYEAVSASLSAIEDYCYTANQQDYIVDANRASYIFCTKPRSGEACSAWAGNKRYCIHHNNELSQFFAPGVVGEMDLHDGTGMFRFDAPWFDSTLSLETMSGFLTWSDTDQAVEDYRNGMTFDPSYAVDYFVNQLIDGAEVAAFDPSYGDGDGTFSTYFTFREHENLPTYTLETIDSVFHNLLTSSISTLESRGYEIYFAEKNNTSAIAADYFASGAYSQLGNMMSELQAASKTYQISVRTAAPAESEEELAARRAEVAQNLSSWMTGYAAPGNYWEVT